MSKLDHERFIKICGMMASQHDGEALAALRKANKMLAEAKLTWAQVMNPMTISLHAAQQAYSHAYARPKYEPAPKPSMDTEVNWSRFFVTEPKVAMWIMENRRFKPFAASLYNFVLKYGRLTEKQIEAVRRIIG